MSELKPPAGSLGSDRLLIVEDDPAQRQLIEEILNHAGFSTRVSPSAENALTLIDEEIPDLVLSDWRLPGESGLDLLRRVKAQTADVAFIMMTAYGTISNAVAAVRAGADDYLTKPFERQALLLAIERTLSTRQLLQENRRLNEALEERDRLVDLVGRSPAMLKLYQRIEKISATSATVLISGESGTGKELVARALHALSKRSEAPFVAVNCAAIPENLMEAEFLGSEKGAFTGAAGLRRGKFEAANGGTLFLDEIGELPLSIQPKLLRAVQEKRVVRVGGNREIATDVRIIAATNRDLGAEVAAGQFREDLFYRLNVVPMVVPPLRERREDIPLLVKHFVGRVTRQHELEPMTIPGHLLKRLMDHPWTGNVRELGNVIERVVLLGLDGELSGDDLPQAPTSLTEEGFVLPPTGINWQAHERSILAQALELTAGNRARAARLLNLPYKAFLYRLERLDLNS